MSQTLSKGLRLIEALANSSEPRGLSELARSLDMNQSAVQRLLNTLVADGYAMQPKGSRKYQLTLSLWQLGMQNLNHDETRRLLRPTLRLGAQASGMTCFFALSALPFVIYFDRVEGPRSQPHSAELGVKVPMVRTASGQAIFPYLSKRLRNGLSETATDWTGLMTAPGTSLEEIDRITEEVRKNRYAVSQSGMRKGRNSVAAPVWGDDPSPLGAVALTASEEVLHPDLFESIGAKVVELAEEATISLGGSENRNAAELGPA